MADLDIIHFKASLENLATKLDDLVVKFPRLADKHEKAKATIKKLEEKVDDLRVKIPENEKKAQTALEQVNELEKKERQAKLDYEELQREYSELQRQDSEYREKLHKCVGNLLDRKIHFSRKDVNETEPTQTDTTQEECVNQQFDLKRLAEKLEKLKKLKDENEELIATKESLVHVVMDLLSDSVLLKSNIEMDSEIIDCWKSRNQIFENRVRKLENNLREMENQARETQNDYAECCETKPIFTMYQMARVLMQRNSFRESIVFEQAKINDPQFTEWMSKNCPHYDGKYDPKIYEQLDAEIDELLNGKRDGHLEPLVYVKPKRQMLKVILHLVADDDVANEAAADVANEAAAYVTEDDDDIL